MGAIEPARQAGSTDTKLDHQLDHDGFAVGILALTQNLSPWAFSRAEKSHRTFRNLRMGQVPLKNIFSKTVGTIMMSVQRSISSPKIMKKELQILVFFALCSLAFLKIGNHKLLKNNFVYILILKFTF